MYDAAGSHAEYAEGVGSDFDFRLNTALTVKAENLMDAHTIGFDQLQPMENLCKIVVARLKNTTAC